MPAATREARDLFAPRAIKSDNEQGKHLLALEVPDCGCPAFAGDGEGRAVLPPCSHVLAIDHTLSLAEWRALLLAYDYQGHADPPAPRRPWVAQTREARLLLYEERAARGLHLYHPDDELEDEDLEVECGRKRRLVGLRIGRRAT